MNTVDLTQNAISLGEVVPPYNTSLHLPGTGTIRYMRAMAVLDERATIAPSMLYLKRHVGTTAQRVGVHLDTWTQTGDIAQSATVQDVFNGRYADDYGEMQISPDGQYLAVTNRVTLPAFLGMLATHEIRLYRIDATDGSLSQVGTRNLPLMGVSGLDFSPDGQFLYFIRTTVLSGNTAMRMEVPALSTPQVVLGGATEVRRTIHGHMLLTKQQDVYTVTDPDAPVLLDAVNSTAVIWSCPDPILFPHVALQPLIIHNERPVAYRHIGRKHYELSDHLGNVRVVVSDIKLSELDITNEPSAFTADVVSRTDYYAFGSPMPGRNYPGQGYRFGFNGKELLFEMSSTHYDFENRFYNADIGRFASVDGMASLMASRSPYAFAANSPVLLIDKDGDIPILPLIFKGLVGAGIDAMMQFTINMVIYDFDPQKAFDKIDMASVAMSGLQGMNPWSIPGGKWGPVAVDVLSDLAVNFAKGNYDGLSDQELARDLFVDVLIGAGVSRGTGVLGEKLAPHMPQIAVWLKEKGLNANAIRRITAIDVEREIENARKRGVARAHSIEIENIKQGGRGFDNVWSASDLTYIRKNGKLPRNVIAHHLYNVGHYPTKASNPANILFINKGSKAANIREHMRLHGGNTKLRTKGQQNKGRAKAHKRRRHTYMKF